MNKTKYNVRHIACNMADFLADRHRFRFEYNGKEYIVPCYGTVNVALDEISDEVPEDILCEIQDIIWNKIDKEEKNWRYPQKVYAIANDYVEENFER